MFLIRSGMSRKNASPFERPRMPGNLSCKGRKSTLDEMWRPAPAPAAIGTTIRTDVFPHTARQTVRLLGSHEENPTAVIRGPLSDLPGLGIAKVIEKAVAMSLAKLNASDRNVRLVRSASASASASSNTAALPTGFPIMRSVLTERGRLGEVGESYSYLARIDFQAGMSA